MSKHGVRMRDKLKPVGRVIFIARAGRFYHDGDGAGFIWRWWHPLAWVYVPVLLLVSCIVYGAPETWRERHDLGLRMKPWFIEHPERLEWENPDG